MKTLGSALVLALTTTYAFAGPVVGYKVDKCDKTTRLPNTATVVAGVDGDTVHISTSVGTFSVRMLGMDTQETHFQGKSQGRWAEEAARVMSEELAPSGTSVTLEFGTDACDSHGRVLAHLFKKGMHINAEMVKRGLAVNYCVAPDFAYCDDFSRYTQNAIDRQLGMFSDKAVELPYDFRRRIENAPQRSFVGNIVTKEVFTPGHQNDVPSANRVFFYMRELVQAPYHVVGEQN